MCHRPKDARPSSAIGYLDMPFLNEEKCAEFFRMLVQCELHLCHINRLDIPEEVILYGYLSQQNTA